LVKWFGVHRSTVSESICHPESEGLPRREGRRRLLVSRHADPWIRKHIEDFKRGRLAAGLNEDASATATPAN
jgi:hypothetical protein